MKNIILTKCSSRRIQFKELIEIRKNFKIVVSAFLIDFVKSTHKKCQIEIKENSIEVATVRGKYYSYFEYQEKFICRIDTVSGVKKYFEIN